jgi:hypothetical protein
LISSFNEYETAASTRMHKYLVRRFVKKSRKERTASKNFT